MVDPVCACAFSHASVQTPVRTPPSPSSLPSPPPHRYGPWTHDAINLSPPVRLFLFQQVVKALLRAGAQVNLRTPEGAPLEVLLCEPLHASSALVRELVLAGADLGRPGGVLVACVCFVPVLQLDAACSM